MQRLSLVTHLSIAVGHAQALGIKVENSGIWRQIRVLAGLDFAEDQTQQNQCDAFWSFGQLHLLGLPLFVWACRAFLQPRLGRVFGNCFEFEKYQPLEGWVDLSGRMA